MMNGHEPARYSRGIACEFRYAPLDWRPSRHQRAARNTQDHSTATKLAQQPAFSGSPRKSSPNTAPPTALPRKSSPSTPKNADFGPFRVRRANFFALTPTPSRAGRTFSRTRHSRMATLKPTTHLRPKNAPKTPVSHPRRRHRFQPHTGTSSQRRQGFQRTEPPGLRGLAAVPVGGGRARAATHERQARPIGGRRGACGAWPGFETTRRAKLAARTARGRAGHAAAGNQAERSNAEHPAGRSNTGDQEAPPTGTHSGKAQRAARPDGARNTDGATSTAAGNGNSTAPGTP